MAKDFMEDNQQRLSMLRDAETSINVVMKPDLALPERTLTSEEANTIINDPQSGAIDRGIALLDTAGSFAAGRGELLSVLPETFARQMKGELNTIKSMISFNRLLEIKKSGAGLGALSDSELTLLGSSLGSLDQGLPPEVLRSRLVTIRHLLNKVRENLTADRTSLSNALTPAAAGQQNLKPPRRLNFNPATGKLEPVQ